MSLRNPLLLAAALLAAALPALAKDQPVAATVNGKPIYESQVSEFTGGPENLNRAQVLGELVTEELVYQDAVKQGLDKNKDVQREIERMRKRVVASAAVQKVLSKNPVTEEETKAEYEKLKARKEYKARHILVESQAKAEEIIKELNGGAKFADLATKYSTDPGAKNGGDLGWFPAEQMVPPFAAAVRSLQKDEYTKSPVQTNFGWHVILLEDTRDMQAPPYADVKDRIKGALQQKRVGQYLEKLRATAKVEVKKP